MIYNLIYFLGFSILVSGLVTYAGTIILFIMIYIYISKTI